MLGTTGFIDYIQYWNWSILMVYTFLNIDKGKIMRYIAIFDYSIDSKSNELYKK